VLFSLLGSLFLFTGISKEIAKLGNVERVFMNITSRGVATKSTTTRKNLIEGALTVFIKYPLGVGAGNWQNKANEIMPHHLMPLEYSHNIFLEVLNEFGVVALLILILLFVYAFHLSYILMQNNSINKSSLYPLIFYASTYFFINSLVSGDINDARLLFVMISFLVIKHPLIEKPDKLC
jgi:O-antigen ligase